MKRIIFWFKAACVLSLMCFPAVLAYAITGQDSLPWYIAAPVGLWVFVPLFFACVVEEQEDMNISGLKRRIESLQEQIDARDS